MTDPSGKSLLSQDAATCRHFTVGGGVFTAVRAHRLRAQIGLDVDHPPAFTVQLMPYKDTPNNGGEYKVWVTRVEDLLLGCQELGKVRGERPGAYRSWGEGGGQRTRLHPRRQQDR